MEINVLLRYIFRSFHLYHFQFYVSTYNKEICLLLSGLGHNKRCWFRHRSKLMSPGLDETIPYKSVGMVVLTWHLMRSISDIYETMLWLNWLHVKQRVFWFHSVWFTARAICRHRLRHRGESKANQLGFSTECVTEAIVKKGKIGRRRKNRRMKRQRASLGVFYATLASGVTGRLGACVVALGHPWARPR